MEFLPERRPARMTGFDYAAGNRYFVTLCTRQKQCLLGDGIKLSPLGQLALRELLDTEKHHVGVTVELCAVMPNHIHAIITLEDVGAGLDPPVPGETCCRTGGSRCTIW